MSPTSFDVGSYLAPLVTVGAGGWGVTLLLLVMGKLHSDSAYRAMETEKEYWRQTADIERKARRKAEDRADVAIETGKVANDILSALKNQARR